MAASTPKEFVSAIQDLGRFKADWSQDQIKNETMLFNSDARFARGAGGPITRAFLDALPEDWQDGIVVDSRVHMLKPGWFPAIPGYHHDDVPRPAIPVGQHFITAGQPDYDSPRYLAEHVTWGW